MYKFSILFTLLFSNFIFAQTMNIHSIDGSITQHNLSEIDSITFSLTGGNLTYILVDNFESYDLNTFPSSGGWVLVYNGYGTSYQFISDSTSVSGSKSLQLEGRSNWSANAVNVLSSTPDIVYLEAFARTKMLAESVMGYSDCAVALHNKDEGSWGISYASVDFRPDGKIKFGVSGVTGVDVQDWAPEQWYKIKIKYDNINKTGSLWIDDILKIENMDLSGPTGEYNSVLLFGGNDTHTRSWFDDVKVWSEE